MTCAHCDPAAGDGVLVRVRVTTYQSHQPLCPSLGSPASDDTTNTPPGRQCGSEGQEEASDA